MDELNKLTKLREAVTKLSKQMDLEIIEFIIRPAESIGDNHTAKIIFLINEEAFEDATKNDPSLDALFMDIVSSLQNQEPDIKGEIDKWLEEE